MNNIELGDFEKRVLEILKRKEESIYRRILEDLNLEERRLNLQEKSVRIEEELRGQRVLLEKLLHQFDKRFEQSDKHIDIIREEMKSRFGQMHEEMKGRFEQMHEERKSRFEQVDKRFDIMHKEMDKRFELVHDDMKNRFQQVDKRFSILTWAMGIGFTLTISILVVVLNFVL